MQNQKCSSYRWVILLAIVPIIISTEMMWLSLAPISSLAEKYYQVSDQAITVFSMSYMIMFILFSLPASWVVDKFGYRHSLIFGAVLTAVFGLIRAIFVDNFTVVIVSQFIIAIGQPFLLNISTKVPANWFPVSERSTAAGILIMAQYIGFAVPMAVAPAIAESSGISTLFMTFAIIAVLSALVAIFLTKEKPAVAPPGPEAPKEDMSLKSLKNLFRNKSYNQALMICFISIGVFNTLLTLIESILIPRGISTVQAGAIGAIFVIAGIAGAALLPILSDKLNKKVPLIIGALLLLIPLYLGFTFVEPFTLLAVIAGLTGFTVMGVAPILFQHASEVAYPIQEGTSLGIILLMGQVSGVLFVYFFEVIANARGSIVIPMVIIVVMTILELPLAFWMKESKLSTTNKTLNS